MNQQFANAFISHPIPSFVLTPAGYATPASMAGNAALPSNWQDKMNNINKSHAERVHRSTVNGPVYYKEDAAKFGVSIPK
jgi:hypothetical protein